MTLVGRFARCALLMTVAVPALAWARDASTLGPLVQNLVVNGDFEKGPEPGAFLILHTGSTQLPGWKVTMGTVDYVGTEPESHNGGRCIDIDGTPGPGALEQTFATKPGRRYEVSFSLSANRVCPPRIKKLRVRAAGRLADFSFDSRGNPGWVRKQWAFSARAAETTLELISLSDNGSSGALVDDVVVIEAGATGK